MFSARNTIDPAAIANLFIKSSNEDVEVTHHYAYKTNAQMVIELIDHLSKQLLLCRGAQLEMWKRELQARRNSVNVEIIHGRYLVLMADGMWTTFEPDWYRLMLKRKV